MSKLSWREWMGVVVVGGTVAVVAFLSLLQVQHWRQDEATLHAVVQLLNYNVAQGRLAGVPAPEAPAATSTPPVSGPEKKP